MGGAKNLTPPKGGVPADFSVTCPKGRTPAIFLMVQMSGVGRQRIAPSLALGSKSREHSATFPHAELAGKLWSNCYLAFSNPF